MPDSDTVAGTSYQGWQAFFHVVTSAVTIWGRSAGFAWYWDESTNEITYKLFDDSTATWGNEMVVQGAMTLTGREDLGMAVAPMSYSAP